MARIAKSDVHAALRRAADRLIAAGGPDERISRDDVKHELATLEGVERALVDLFFRFVDHRDHEPGAVVTVTDVEEAYRYATVHLIDAYDKNDNGLSSDEVAKMSTIGKLAVALALELAEQEQQDERGERTVIYSPSAADEPIYIGGFDPAVAEAELDELTADLHLLSEAAAELRPIVVPLAPTAELDVDTVRRLFAEVHGDLARDIFGYERGEPFELADAHGEERDFAEWFVWRRMPEDLEDALAVELAVRTGELIDYLVANVPAPRVFAYSDQTTATGHPAGVVSVFIVGRAPDGWLLGVFTASVER